SPHHRAGPRQRAVLHRPVQGRRGSGAVVVLQPTRGSRGAGCGSRRACAHTRRGAHPRARGHQARPARGVGHGHRRGDRLRSRSPGRADGVGGLLPRLPRVRGEGNPEVRRGLMPHTAHLAWPFFDDSHRALAREVDAWAARELAGASQHADLDQRCRDFVRRLGVGGWLRHAVPAPWGGARESLDLRSICLVRATLAPHDALAEFCFALQGLGAGPVSLFGSEALRRKYLPPVADGSCIAGFAISERNAGSDVAAMTTAARADGDGYVISGEKTWISNAGIADHYVVFCRMPELGERAFGAFMVDADAAGLTVSERIDVMRSEERRVGTACRSRWSQAASR